MSWSLTETFTGSWSIPGLPSAAVDDDNNLLVTWFDLSGKLNMFYSSINNASHAPIPTIQPPSPTDVQGSPSSVYASGSFYIFWRAGGAGQLNYGILDTNNLSQGLTSTQALPGAFSADGPQVTLAGGPGQPFLEPSIYVAWRGTGQDEQLYSGYLDNLTQSPTWNDRGLFLDASMQSAFSPAVAASQPGFMYAVWRGIENNSQSDPKLYYSYIQNFSTGTYNALTPINNGTLQTNDRPSLGAFSGGSGSGVLVAVYPNNGNFYSTTGTYSAGELAVSWGSQQQLPTGGLGNPVGLLVSNPSPASPLYLLIGERVNGFIANALYLYKFLPD